MVYDPSVTTFMHLFFRLPPPHGGERRITVWLAEGKEIFNNQWARSREVEKSHFVGPIYQDKTLLSSEMNNHTTKRKLTMKLMKWEENTYVVFKNAGRQITMTLFLRMVETFVLIWIKM